jgi:hypothetical protein
MYACIPEIGGGFFEVVCTPTNATAHPRHPALCTGPDFAPLSAPIIQGKVQHDLPTEEPFFQTLR